jgi:hypothetical protein
MTLRQLLPAAALACVAAILSSCAAEPATNTTSSAAPAAAPQPADLKSDPRYLGDDLPLLPVGVVAAVRPVGVVRATYEFAARHPEVMKYVPCFCGCERGGHQDNHDCFVAQRGADDRVTQWDTHAIGCMVCIDVANDALQMHNSGASVSAIRSTIDKKYAPHYDTHTPTPKPKTGGPAPD